MKSTVVKLATVGMVAIMAAGSMAFVQSERVDGAKEGETHTEYRGCGKKRSCGVGGEERMLHRLDLTAEQKTQIESIRASFRTENAATFTLMESLHSRMREARASGDQTQMRALHQEMRAAKESLRPATDRMNEQIRAVLTPEQIAKLDARGNRRGGCRGGRDKQPEAVAPSAPPTSTPGIE
jgi:Spy/CpxP family protein refolding chaperone